MKNIIAVFLLSTAQISVLIQPTSAQEALEPPPPPTAEELAAEEEKQAQAKRQELYEQAVTEDEKISAKLEQEPFSGITIAGQAMPQDLYPLQSVEADTDDITDLAIEFIDLFADSDQIKQLVYKDMQSPNWRKWRADEMPRTHGVNLLDMDAAQRNAAMAILEEILSIEGYEEITSIMTLNAVTGELNSAPEIYNEQMYWFSIFGDPQDEQPWGLQVDGNNLSLNFVVIGNQVVLSPLLLAAEPALAPTGTQYAGETALQFKHDGALSFIQSLEEAQQKQAIMSPEKTENQLLGAAMNDNIDFPQEGLNATNLTSAEKESLLHLISLWVGDLRDDHASIWLTNIQAHLNDTYIAWWGDISGEEPFYLRITSPVLIIEFDHQSTDALKSNPVYAGSEPRLDHIKTVVRQPNGNDYGKALLQSLKAYQAQ